MTQLVTIEGLDKLSRKFADLPSRVEEKVKTRAANKAISKLNTLGARELSKKVKLKQKLVKGRLRVKKASRFRTTASILILHAPIRSGDIAKLTRSKLPSQKKAGAKVGQHFFPGGFVARMPSGRVGVFKRKGQARLPIKEESVKINPPARGIFKRLLNTTIRGVYMKELNRLLGLEIKRRSRNA